MNMHPLWLVVAAVGMGIVPIVLGVITSYLKISIVLGMLRNALGTQQVPGNMVVMALSLAMTCFVMGPVFDQSMQAFEGEKFEKLLRSAPTVKNLEILTPVIAPWKEFMARHSSEREILLFLQLSEQTKGEIQLEPSTLKQAQESFRIIVPSFVVTELKRAFTMAFMVLLPFLMVDLIVANVLAGMGMQMMSPVMVSLPLKILLFVASDGWLLLVRGLVNSYQ